MRGRIVLTISRQLGSGGSAIGGAVAERLNLRYADRDILQRAAEALGVGGDDAEVLDERVQSVWQRLAPAFWIPIPGGPAIPGVTALSDSALFEAEGQIIRALASKEDVVIVGRGGAHLLKDQPGLFSVFVHASEDFRTARVAETLGVDAAAALEVVRRSDRDRAAFHRKIAGCDWVDATQYHLTLDASKVGIEVAVNMVVELLEPGAARG